MNDYYAHAWNVYIILYRCHPELNKRQTKRNEFCSLRAFNKCRHLIALYLCAQQWDEKISRNARAKNMHQSELNTTEINAIFWIFVVASSSVERHVYAKRNGKPKQKDWYHSSRNVYQRMNGFERFVSHFIKICFLARCRYIQLVDLPFFSLHTFSS